MWRIYVVVVLFTSASCGAGFDDVGGGCSKCLVSLCLVNMILHTAVAASTIDQAHEILLVCPLLVTGTQDGYA